MSNSSNYANAHDYSKLISRWRLICRAAGMRMQRIISYEGCPIYEIRSPVLSVSGGIYISAGMHGDEVGAVEGLAQWAEAKAKELSKIPLLIFPCLNPWGMKNNTRSSEAGIDLNRAWGGVGNALTACVQQRIEAMNFRGTLNLHEDYDAGGVYLYELSRGKQNKNLGATVMSDPKFPLPIDRRKLVEGRKMQNGIIRPRPRKIPADEMPEALYLFKNHTDLGFTFETPSEADFFTRSVAHVQMIEAYVEQLQV